MADHSLGINTTPDFSPFDKNKTTPRKSVSMETLTSEEGKPDAILLPLISNCGLEPPLPNSKHPEGTRRIQSCSWVLKAQVRPRPTPALRPGFVSGSAGPRGLSPPSTTDFFKIIIWLLKMVHAVTAGGCDFPAVIYRNI